MKVVINTCYGGFSLSPLATKRYAELIGRECFFYTTNYFDKSYKLITIEETESSFFWQAFDELITEEMTNAYYAKHNLYLSNLERNDPFLIQVVEELGDKSWGKYAELNIIEIPDGISYKIEEYDGREWISETHRTWS
jgi:hypothetical protein